MKLVSAKNAPGAIGPYCHAVVYNNTAFLSGQIPLDPETMNIAGSDIETQTAQVFKNIKAVLSDLGIGMERIIKTTVFLKSMEDFAGMNQVYEKALNGHKPARSAIEVARLPKDALVEIECIAATK